MSLLVKIETSSALTICGSITEAIDYMQTDNQFSVGILFIYIEGSDVYETFKVQKQVIFNEMTKESTVQLLMESV